MADERNVVRAGAAALIEDGTGKVLIAKRGTYPEGIWVLPGGGIDFGERAEDTVVREIKEETGLEIKPVGLIKVYEMILPKLNVHRIIFFYRAKLVGGTARPSSDITEIRWLLPNEIALLDNLGDTVIDVLKMAKLI
ncbi:MAG: NUDIX hydrolase [Candidatus Micrarchaeaceae archaeon]